MNKEYLQSMREREEGREVVKQDAEPSIEKNNKVNRTPEKKKDKHLKS